MNPPEERRIAVSEGVGAVTALILRPEDASALLVFAHGAGAGMRHRFMDEVSRRLADRDIATLRFQFPYMEQGKRAPNRPPILVETVRAVVEEAHRADPDLPLFAGGRSMGGRMTSTAASQAPLPGVRGLVFFGFPLHAAGRPSSSRGAHLAEVEVPMLFLQGTRDKLADLELLGPLLLDVGPLATLHVVAGADHGFHVLKRSGRSDDDVLNEIGDRVRRWVDEVLAGH